MEVCLGESFTPIVFGDAAPSVPSFHNYFGGNVCALQDTFLDGILSNVAQVWIIVKSIHLSFLVMVPPVVHLL